MSFRLLGVNVEVQLGFWLTCLLLGLPILSDPGQSKMAMLAWFGVVFVSILVHEFGHALAIKRHKIEPEISLHWLGGTTSWRPSLPISRYQNILISLSGPFAGFLLGGLIFAFVRLAPELVSGLPILAQWTIRQLIWVNIGWGIINLLPVLPWDGGHVLENALGPKRPRAIAMISFAAGALAALLFLRVGMIFAAVLFGFSAFQSLQRLRAVQPASGRAPARHEPPPPDESIPPEITARLRTARHALAEDDLDRARAIATAILDGEDLDEAPPRAAVLAAFEVIAWTQLLGGDSTGALKTLQQSEKLGTPDPALGGAVLLARGELKAARKVLEEARAAGDDRKEIGGPLVQVLVEQGEIARAAAVAFDMVEMLSEEDARRMGELAFEGGSYEWAARLSEAVFQRLNDPDDAYAAARAHAKDGQPDRALELLRRAVDAGFSDRARAWSDAALEALRSGRVLEAIVPRP